MNEEHARIKLGVDNAGVGPGFKETGHIIQQETRFIRHLLHGFGLAILFEKGWEWGGEIAKFFYELGHQSEAQIEKNKELARSIKELGKDLEKSGKSIEERQFKSLPADMQLSNLKIRIAKQKEEKENAESLLDTYKSMQAYLKHPTGEGQAEYEQNLKDYGYPSQVAVLAVDVLRTEAIDKIGELKEKENEVNKKILETNKKITEEARKQKEEAEKIKEAAQKTSNLAFDKVNQLAGSINSEYLPSHDQIVKSGYYGRGRNKNKFYQSWSSSAQQEIDQLTGGLQSDIAQYGHNNVNFDQRKDYIESLKTQLEKFTGNEDTPRAQLIEARKISAAAEDQLKELKKLNDS